MSNNNRKQYYQHLKLADTNYRFHKGDKYGSNDYTVYSLETDGIVLEIPRKLALAFSEYISQAEAMRKALGETCSPRMKYDPDNVNNVTEGSVMSSKYSEVVEELLQKERTVIDYNKGETGGAITIDKIDSRLKEGKESYDAYIKEKFIEPYAEDNAKELAKEIDKRIAEDVLDNSRKEYLKHILNDPLLSNKERQEKHNTALKAIHDALSGRESEEKEVYLEHAIDLQNGPLHADTLHQPFMAGLVGIPNSEEDSAAQNELFADKWLKEHAVTKSVIVNDFLSESREDKLFSELDSKKEIIEQEVLQGGILKPHTTVNGNPVKFIVKMEEIQGTDEYKYLAGNLFGSDE